MVQIISKDGERLAPTNRHGKVRHMIQDNKAVVVNRNPFTVQLLYDHNHGGEPKNKEGNIKH